MLTRHDTRKLFKFGIFFLFSATIITYSIFASHNLILGPDIEIYTPDTNRFSTSSIEISGKVFRSQDITINDKSITMDENGIFSEYVVLKDGYNIFKIQAKDRLKRSKDYRLTIFNKLK